MTQQQKKTRSDGSTREEVSIVTSDGEVYIHIPSEAGNVILSVSPEEAELFAEYLVEVAGVARQDQSTWN